MGPAIHHLTYPLQGWKITREDNVVTVTDAHGEVASVETCKDDVEARRAVRRLRTEAYASAELRE